MDTLVTCSIPSAYYFSDDCNNRQPPSRLSQPSRADHFVTMVTVVMVDSLRRPIEKTGISRLR